MLECLELALILGGILAPALHYKPLSYLADLLCSFSQGVRCCLMVVGWLAASGHFAEAAAAAELALLMFGLFAASLVAA